LTRHRKQESITKKNTKGGIVEKMERRIAG